jgi:hypothetical protein
MHSFLSGNPTATYFSESQNLPHPLHGIVSSAKQRYDFPNHQSSVMSAECLTKNYGLDLLSLLAQIMSIEFLYKELMEVANQFLT